MGLFLWNLVYDRLLDTLDNMVMVKATTFADDLAITCAIRRNEGVSAKVNGLLKIVCDWCASVGLTLTMDKTEIMLITGMRVPRVVSISVGDAIVRSVESIRYLGVILDTREKFDKHVEAVCAKADIPMGALRGILPNINVPPNVARRLYYNVWEFIVLYGAPVWASAVDMEKNRKTLIRVQRTALCITTTAYQPA